MAAETPSWPDAHKVAFGLYKLGGAPKDDKNIEEIENAIDAAMEAGYRAYDSAEMY